MSVELWYVDGCPHWAVAETRLREALDRVGRQDPVLLHRIDTPEEADRIGFVGSPTIRLDGRDPFLPAASSPGLACRLYVTESGLNGAPTVEQLIEVLKHGVRSRVDPD
jgi:hypothetical protein